MNIVEDDVEFLIIKAIESKFLDALIDQYNEKVDFNNVLKRNIGTINQKELQNDLKNLIVTLENFEIGDESSS